MGTLNDARRKAKRMKLINTDEELQESTRKNKRFMIWKDDTWIHFGIPYKDLMVGTYLDHGDRDIRDKWRARHKKIMKNGKPAWKDKTSPEYYSYRILW